MPRAKKGAAPKKQPSRPRRKNGQKNLQTSSPGMMERVSRYLPFVGPAVAAGTAAAKLVSWVTGHGDYKISGNSLLGSGAPPSFSRDGDGIRVRHREFIADVSSIGAAFNNTAYALNPGLPAVFPWLSTIAAGFEQYKFEGLILEFRSLSAVAVSSTNTALGAVVLATNYDPYDPQFINKQQMEGYEFSCSGPPCASMLHPIECASRMTVDPIKYVRAGGAPPGTDLRMYDMGLFQIATVGQQAASNIGEIWITYDVRFFKPKLPLIGAATATYSARHTPVTLVSDFATPVPGANNTLSVTYPSVNSFRINQNGRFLINWLCSAAAYSPGGLFTASAGAATTPGTVLVMPWTTGSGAAAYQMTYIVDCVGDVSGPGGVVSKVPATISGACTAALMITQIPSNIT